MILCFTTPTLTSQAASLTHGASACLSVSVCVCLSRHVCVSVFVCMSRPTCLSVSVGVCVCLSRHVCLPVLAGCVSVCPATECDKAHCALSADHLCKTARHCAKRCDTDESCTGTNSGRPNEAVGRAEAAVALAQGAAHAQAHQAPLVFSSHTQPL